MTPARQRGTVMIAAILVVAIAATASAGLLYSQTLAVHEFELHADAAQSRLAARAGIAWAAAVLHQDARVTSVDTMQEPWATPLPVTHVEGTEIGGRISDLQGRYNLNNLVRAGNAQPAEVARYKRLLAALGLPEALAETAVDWMDADAKPSGAGSSAGAAGAEDDYYHALASPYRTTGAPLADIHELLRVRGYTADVFAALTPYVAALPAPSAINVNTAPPEVLMLVAEGLTLADARLLAAARERLPFRDASDFRARLPAAAHPLEHDLVRVSSEYFLIDAEVRRAQASVRAQAIVQRGRGAWPVVIWQRLAG